MANKKVNYNEIKKDFAENEQLKEAFSTKKEKYVYKKIKISEIKEDPKGDFNNIFPYNEEDAKRLSEKMINKGYDASQPIHIAKILTEPETIENPIRIDGRHRTEAAKMAGLEEIPVYEHTFDDRTEAMIYAIELQVLRRNLTDAQKVKAIMLIDELKNPGKKAEGNTEKRGKSAEETAQKIGMSTRNVEKVRSILNNGSEETKEQLLNNDITINKAYGRIKPRKRNPEEENESEALTDNSGNPGGLNFQHSDGIERPPIDHSIEYNDTEEDRIILARREEHMKGYSEGFETGLNFAIAEIKKGRTPEEVYKDERVQDLSYIVISKFVLPEDDQDIINSIFITK